MFLNFVLANLHFLAHLASLQLTLVDVYMCRLDINGWHRDTSDVRDDAPTRQYSLRATRRDQSNV